MEKLLGKNYKWLYLLKFRFRARTISSFDNSLFAFGQFLVLVGTLITWWLANNKIIDLGLQQKWNYFVIGELFFSIIYNFAEFDAFDILEGKHVSTMLWPQNYFVLKFFDTYGQSLFQNSIKSVILLILISIMGITQNLISCNFLNLLGFVFLIPLGLILLYLMEIIVSFSAFFMPQVNGPILNFTFLLSFLMGRIFPLDLLVPNFWVNLFNPPSYLFYHPMQIYLGKYTFEQTIWCFAGGIFWCFALYFLARLVFRLGLKRNESVGL